MCVCVYNCDLKQTGTGNPITIYFGFVYRIQNMKGGEYKGSVVSLLFLVIFHFSINQR